MDIAKMLKEMARCENPSLAFKSFADSNPDEAKRLFDAVGGSTNLASELGYKGKHCRTKARWFRKLINTPDKTNPVRFKSEIENDGLSVQEKLSTLLTKNREKRYTIGDLCETVDRSPSTVKAALEELRGQGIVIHQVDEESVTLPLVAQRQEVDLEIDFQGDSFTFGAISDTHLGSRHAAEDMLEAAYDYYEAEGIENVLHEGDMTEGPGERGYRGHANDVWYDCQRWDGMEAYAHRNYPRRNGVKTLLISSSKSHCGWEWNASGRDVCSDIVNGRNEIYNASTGEVVIPALEPRDDMVYLGHDSADVLMGPGEKVRIRMFHPDGGGSYALSYNPQKFVEAMPSGSKPHLFLVGHYHQFFHARIRNVNVICVPGCQWMTPLFRRYGKEPVVGALAITVHVDKHGSVRSVDVKDLCHYYEPSGSFNRG